MKWIYNKQYLSLLMINNNKNRKICIFNCLDMFVQCHQNRWNDRHWNNSPQPFYWQSLHNILVGLKIINKVLPYNSFFLITYCRHENYIFVVLFSGGKRVEKRGREREIWGTMTTNDNTRGNKSIKTMEVKMPIVMLMVFNEWKENLLEKTIYYVIFLPVFFFFFPIIY